MPIKAIILSLCLLAALCTRAADEQKIDSIVSQMTLEEKVGLCYGNFMHFRGVERLSGARVTARDLRGGAALAIAGLAAQGETVVERARLIDRGYEHLETALSHLGADIQRISAEKGEKHP